MRRRRVLSKLVMLRRRQERFRGNAADVDTCPAERPVHLDANGAQPELGGTNGGDVPPGAATDDDDVSGGRSGRIGGSGAQDRNCHDRLRESELAEF